MSCLSPLAWMPCLAALARYVRPPHLNPSGCKPSACRCGNRCLLGQVCAEGICVGGPFTCPTNCEWNT